MKTLMNRFVRDESGATAIEYGLIAALISVVIIVVLQRIGGGLLTRFGTVAEGLGN
jgi:pilus assembly protein Flp/PilA